MSQTIIEQLNAAVAARKDSLQPSPGRLRDLPTGEKRRNEN